MPVYTRTAQRPGYQSLMGGAAPQMGRMNTAQPQQQQMGYDGKMTSYTPPVDNPADVFIGRQAPEQPGLGTMSRASTMPPPNPLSASGGYGYHPGTDGYDPSKIFNNVTGANIDRGRGVDPANTNPAYWQSIADVGDIGLQESARRRGFYQAGYDPYQQRNREEGGIGGYTAGQSPGLAALLGGAGGGFRPTRGPGTGQAQPPRSTAGQTTVENIDPNSTPTYSDQPPTPATDYQWGNDLQEILRRYGQGGTGGQGGSSMSSGGSASNQNNINIYTGRYEDGSGTEEQFDPDAASAFINPILDRLDKPGDPLPQTPGSISGLQGDVAGLLQRFLTGGGAGEMGAGTAGLQELLRQMNTGTGLAGQVNQPAGNSANALLGNMPGLTQKNITDLISASMPNGYGSNPGAETLQGYTSGLLSASPRLTHGGIDEYTSNLMPGGFGSGINPNASTLGNSTDYLLGRNALPTFAPATYDPQTGRAYSGTLSDLAQSQYADILLGKNPVANDLRNTATANTGKVNDVLGSFLGGPAFDIISKNFGSKVGTEMDRSQDATRRATDIANAIGNWGVTGTQELGNAGKNLLGTPGQALGKPGELNDAASFARMLAGLNTNPGNVTADQIGPSPYLQGSADYASKLANMHVAPSDVSATNIGGNAALDKAIAGASGSQISPELQKFINSSMSGGLPAGFADAFKRQVYDPQREALLGDLNRRGVLDSGDRLDKERDLFNQQFMDQLTMKSLDQSNIGADKAMQAAGLGQNAVQQLLGASGQQTDIAGRNQAAKLQAGLANQDASLRAAGLIGSNIGRGSELLMGAGGQANDIAGRNQAANLQAGTSNQDAALRAAGLLGSNVGRGAELLTGVGNASADIGQRNISNDLERLRTGAGIQGQAYGQATGAANLLGQMGDSAYNRATGNVNLPTNVLMQSIDRAQGGSNSATGSLAQLLAQAAGTGQQAQQNRNQEYGLGLQGYQQQSDERQRATDRSVQAKTQLQQLLNQQYGLGLEGYGRTSADIGQAQNYGTQLQQLLNQQYGMGLQGAGMNSDAAMQLLGLQSGIYGDMRNFGLNATNAGFGHATDLIGQQLNKDAGIYSADQQRKGSKAIGIGSAIGGIGSTVAAIIA